MKNLKQEASKRGSPARDGGFANTVKLGKCFTYIHQCLFAPSPKIILLSCPLLGISQRVNVGFLEGQCYAYAAKKP